MPKNQQDAEDMNSLGLVFGDPRYIAAHDEMMKDRKFLLKKRRDRLTVIYTNSCDYDELGWGLQELINYVIKLEDACPTTRADIRLMSYKD